MQIIELTVLNYTTVILKACNTLHSSTTILKILFMAPRMVYCSII